MSLEVLRTKFLFEGKVNTSFNGVFTHLREHRRAVRSQYEVTRVADMTFHDNRGLLEE